MLLTLFIRFIVLYMFSLTCLIPVLWKLTSARLLNPLQITLSLEP